MKTYRELTREERLITMENYHRAVPEEDWFESFEEYDEENEFLDMEFDSDTLECLG